MQEAAGACEREEGCGGDVPWFVSGGVEVCRYAEEDVEGEGEEGARGGRGLGRGHVFVFMYE